MLVIWRAFDQMSEDTEQKYCFRYIYLTTHAHQIHLNTWL